MTKYYLPGPNRPPPEAAEYHHHTRGRPNTVFQQSGQQFAHVHNQLGACSLCILPTPWGLLATANPNSTLLYTG